jgi:hypothetical protein
VLTSIFTEVIRSPPEDSLATWKAPVEFVLELLKLPELLLIVTRAAATAGELARHGAGQQPHASSRMRTLHPRDRRKAAPGGDGVEETESDIVSGGKTKAAEKQQFRGRESIQYSLRTAKRLGFAA